MREGCLGLVMSSPPRPSPDESGPGDRGQQQSSDQVADLRHARRPDVARGQAASGSGLLSFGLLLAA
jgi:hypothetical protein